MRHRFYVLEPGQPVAQSPSLDGEYRVELWRPTATRVSPPSVPGIVFKVWWLLHHARVFANRDYALLLVYRSDRLVHRSGVFPRYLRFPFMAGQDLQIGDTWTEPDERGRGLAGLAVRVIIDRLRRPGRRFWYLVEEDNAASIRVIERAGFRFLGVGERVPRMGIRLLGAFRVNQLNGSEQRA